MKEWGKKQGDMSPHVSDYQEPSSVFSQEGFSKTTQYVERKNAQMSKDARDIKKNGYKGRYS